MTIKVNDKVVVQNNLVSRHRPVYAVGQNILVKRERGGTWHTVGIIGGRLNENVICHRVGGEWIAIRNETFRLVLEYLFNEGSGTILHDTSGFGHHANMVGTDWNWHHDAIHGWTVNFHGPHKFSHIFVGRPTHFSMDASFSVEVIVRNTETTTAGWTRGIAGRSHIPKNYNEFLIFMRGTASTTGFKRANISHPSIFTNIWATHLIVVNAVTNRVSYFIDDVLIGAGTFDHTMSIDGADLVFGIIHPHGFDIHGIRYRSMIGQIAQIRVWDRAIR